MYVNLMPMKVIVDGNLTLKDFMLCLRKNLINTIFHHYYPYHTFCKEQNIHPSIFYSFQSSSITESCEIEGAIYKVEYLPKGNSSSSLNILIIEKEKEYETTPFENTKYLDNNLYSSIENWKTQFPYFSTFKDELLAIKLNPPYNLLVDLTKNSEDLSWSG